MPLTLTLPLTPTAELPALCIGLHAALGGVFVPPSAHHRGGGAAGGPEAGLEGGLDRGLEAGSGAGLMGEAEEAGD
eukprot:scaffold92286_cov21-Phaeocystis_antarctica.AAC.1